MRKGTYHRLQLMIFPDVRLENFMPQKYCDCPFATLQHLILEEVFPGDAEVPLPLLLLRTERTAFGYSRDDGNTGFSSIFPLGTRSCVVTAYELLAADGVIAPLGSLSILS